jgi:leucine dehydrogenase
MKIENITAPGYELVVRGTEPESDYHGIVAVHSSALGPAVGGTRLWTYANTDDALIDALRLAKGMTYKSSLAGLPFGGGKSVILRPASFDRERLFRAHGRLVESLGGRYVTAEDVGTSTADMDVIRLETTHVSGLAGRSGDPSPLTARGVFHAMRAAAQFRWKSDSLAGKTVAIQGCGNVGKNLAGLLNEAGAKLVVSDLDEARAIRISLDYDGKFVRPEALLESEFDIFSPCALGGVINDETIALLRGKVICGGANNQLLEPRHGEVLAEHDILYAPDYAANAGGIVNGAIELAAWSREYTLQRIDNIYETLLNIFHTAERDRIPTYKAADRLAEERLHAAAMPAR